MKLDHVTASGEWSKGFLPTLIEAGKMADDEMEDVALPQPFLELENLGDMPVYQPSKPKPPPPGPLTAKGELPAPLPAVELPEIKMPHEEDLQVGWIAEQEEEDLDFLVIASLIASLIACRSAGSRSRRRRRTARCRAARSTGVCQSSVRGRAPRPRSRRRASRCST